MKKKQLLRQRRKAHIRAKVVGSKERPRLSVFRSNKYIYAQLIEDQSGTTIISMSDEKKVEKNKVESAKKIGLELAKKAIEKGIEKVVFDRSGYKYHGRVKALAEGAREGGLKF